MGDHNHLQVSREVGREVPITLNDTTTAQMTTEGDERETRREPGKNPFPVSRVQKILKVDTVRLLSEEPEPRN